MLSLLPSLGSLTIVSYNEVMIAYLKGTILEFTKEGAIIHINGVGYEVVGSWLGKFSVNEEVEVYTYEYLENSSIPRLIACRSFEARSIFLSLLSVSGVGPKMAGRIVDALNPQELISAITSGDLEVLGKVKGLGKKTAQKIILELGKILVTSSTSKDANLIEALSSLKFTPQEIKDAIAHTDLQGLSESAQISALLKTLGKSK